MFVLGPGSETCKIANITFKNNSYWAGMFFITDVNNIFFEDIFIQNNIGEDFGAFATNNCGNIFLKNIDVNNNFSEGGVAGVRLTNCTYAEIIGCRFINNFTEGDLAMTSGVSVSCTGDIINNSLYDISCAFGTNPFNDEIGKIYILNCLIIDNEAIGNEKIAGTGSEEGVIISNCTFSNNSINYTLMTIGEVTIANSIFLNDCNCEIISL